jgi:hypothetical protein
MLARILRCKSALLGFSFLCAAAGLATQPAPPGPLLVVHLREVPVLLAWPWHFHVGDDPAWANPKLEDSNWELISAARPWARQGHENYTGFAWYRLHVEFQQQGLESPGAALLIPHVDDAYELYWNGVLVGRNGRFPPHPIWPLHSQPPQIFSLGPVHSGVLALRVWKAPFLSEDSGLHGGFAASPVVGTPYSILMEKQLLDYRWLHSHQLLFGINTLYGIVGLLTLLAWIRNPEQWQLFWMAGFAITRILEMVIYHLRFPIPLSLANAVWQPFSAFHTVALWFLLLWLLQLRQSGPLVRLTRVCAWIALTTNTADGLLCLFIARPQWTIAVQVGDAVLTALYAVTLMLPLVLVSVAVTRSGGLNKARWIVAICAFVAGMVEVIIGISHQGSRFTHWTIGDRLADPLFTWNGNDVSLFTITSTLLLLASAYAVYRSFEENRRRQLQLNTEFENARALQHILVPEEPPEVPGFRVTCVYRPALEVGGDFVQVIPLENPEGGTLVILGDVSGKGLRAAMAVSFIVGTVHALVQRISSPGLLLAELNERLRGRLDSGFTTAVALRVEKDGRCTIAGAGHPPPFVQDREVEIKGSLPLGLFPGTVYDEVEFVLEPGETCMLYTDGLTEARNKDGELYGEERLSKLLAGLPTAHQIAEAAIDFGQDDDVTILSFTRLKSEAFSAPSTETAAIHENAIRPENARPAVIG